MKSPKSKSLSSGTALNKKSSSLPNDTVEYLKKWMMSPEHIAHPYPTDSEKAKIMEETGIELKQLTNWFVNNRKRFWKPRVEAKGIDSIKSKSEATDDKPSSTVSVSDSMSSSQSPFQSKLTRSVDLTTVELVNTSSSLDEVENDLDICKTSCLDSNVNKGNGSNSCVSNVGSTSLPDHSHLVESSSDYERPLKYVNRVSTVSLTESGNVSQMSSDDESPVRTNDRVKQHNMKTELIDVHILRPTGKGLLVPQLEDVSVLPYLPEDRILRSFEKCPIAYNCHVGYAAQYMTNQELVEVIATRRNAELERVRSESLTLYLNELNESEDADSQDSTQSDCKRSIAVSFSENDCLSPRPKFRRVSVDTWRKACGEACHVYEDQDLPTLEEAAQLFGFAIFAQSNCH